MDATIPAPLRSIAELESVLWRLPRGGPPRSSREHRRLAESPAASPSAGRTGGAAVSLKTSNEACSPRWPRTAPERSTAISRSSLDAGEALPSGGESNVFAAAAHAGGSGVIGLQRGNADTMSAATCCCRRRPCSGRLGLHGVCSR